MIELLRSIFPNTSMLFISVLWVVISMIASTLFNNQDIANKKSNAWKSFLILFFAFSWAMTNTYYASGRWYPGFLLFALIVWVLFLIGDRLAYWSHQLKFSPGGFPGWVWFSVARYAKDLQTRATTRAYATLRPTERKLYEAAVSEKNENILKALVEVTGTKIIVAPPSIADAVPGIDRLIITPSYVINAVPKSLLVETKKEIFTPEITTVENTESETTESGTLIPAVSPSSEMSVPPHTEP